MCSKQLSYTYICDHDCYVLEGEWSTSLNKLFFSEATADTGFPPCFQSGYYEEL